jgi:uncharacterized protein
LLSMQFPSIGQSDKTNLTERVIEVTGTAEMLINPNEYTFDIILNERFENKEKITIDKQEAKLKEELASIGIDIQKDLTITNVSSVFTTQKRKKDVLGSKEYTLKVYDLTKIEKLQQIADKLDFGKLDLARATHTELAKFRKETKMEAIKAAKLKAEYMLEAIGETIGKPVLIQEIVGDSDYQSYLNRMQGGAISSNSMVMMREEMRSGETLSFSKIQLKYSVLARFEIK